MFKGLGDKVDKGKRIALDLNVELDDDEDCYICVEPLGNKNNDRTVVKLCCQHKFHLDCIGSAFNAKYKMECPNCRNVEKGHWLYASGPPNQDFMLDDDTIAEEYGNEQEELPPIDLRSFPNLVPPTMLIGSLPAPLYRGPLVFPYGPRQFGGNGIPTNPWLPPYGPNQFLYGGLTSSDILRLDLAMVNMMLQKQMDQSLAVLECNINLHRSMGSYGGGESSRSGCRRRGAGGGSGNGRGSNNCGKRG